MIKFNRASDIFGIDGIQKSSLKYHCHLRMAGKDNPRSVYPIHASDLTKDDFCPRRYVLMERLGCRNPAMFLSTSVRATYDLGKSLQDILVLDWVTDLAIGTWKCQRCDKLYSFQKVPESCCGARRFKYIEEKFISPNGYTGSIDLIINLGGLYTIVEVKTIVKDDFKKLSKMPLAEHRARTNLYLRLLKDCSSEDDRVKKINTDHALIFYICKGYGVKDSFVKDHGLFDSGFSPFKEYSLNYDKELADYYVSSSLLVKKGVQSEKLPDRVCTSITEGSNSMKCHMVNRCWNARTSLL